MTPRPLCLAASLATRCQRATRAPARLGSMRTTARAVVRGTMRATPSSVAMRMIPSIFSPFGMPWASTRRQGDSLAASSRARMVPSAPRGPTRSIRTVSTPPVPSRASTTAPAPSRSTRVRWRVSWASKVTRVPETASGRT